MRADFAAVVVVVQIAVLEIDRDGAERLFPECGDIAASTSRNMRTEDFQVRNVELAGASREQKHAQTVSGICALGKPRRVDLRP